MGTRAHSHSQTYFKVLTFTLPSPVALSQGPTPKKIQNSLHPPSSVEKPPWGRHARWSHPPPPDTGGGAGGWGGRPCRGAEEAAEKPDKPRAKKVKRMQRARFHKNRFCASSLTQAHFSSFAFPRRPLSSLFFHPGTQLPLLPSPTRGSAPPCRAGQLRGAPAAGRGGGAQGHPAFPDARASRPHPGGPALFLLRVPL